MSSKQLVIVIALLVVAAGFAPVVAAHGQAPYGHHEDAPTETPSDEVDEETESEPEASDSEETQETTDSTDESDEAEERAPGMQFSGLIGVLTEQLDGEIEGREFGAAISTAASSKAKADVVAKKTQNLEARLTDLEERQNKLEARYEAGEISKERYEASLSRLETKRANIERLIETISIASTEINEADLDERGVSTEKLADLHARSDTLKNSDGEAAMMRFAGNSGVIPAGNAFGFFMNTPAAEKMAETANEKRAEALEKRAGERKNKLDARTSRTLDKAQRHLDRSQHVVSKYIDDHGEDADAIKAQKHLTTAENELETARSLLESDEPQKAMKHAIKSIASSKQAIHAISQDDVAEEQPDEKTAESPDESEKPEDARTTTATEQKP